MKRKSRFEYEVPMKISFVAPSDIDDEALQKLAMKHLEMALKIQIFEVDEKRLTLKREQKILTKEEIEAEERFKDMPFDKWLIAVNEKFENGVKPLRESK